MSCAGMLFESKKNNFKFKVNNSFYNANFLMKITKQELIKTINKDDEALKIRIPD